MHSAIVEVSTSPITKANRLSDFFEDCFLESVSDYYGEPYDASQRRAAIRGVAEMLDGIAVVNVARGTITVADAATVKAQYQKWIDGTAGELKTRRERQDGWLSADDVRSAFERFRECPYLFVLNGCSQFSADFAADLRGYAGRTLYIGGVLDYHY